MGMGYQTLSKEDITMNTLQKNYPLLNLHGIELYIKHGGENFLGGFATALINNDLRDAVSRADHINIDLIPTYVMWLSNEAPSACWGYEGVSKEWAGMDYYDNKHNGED
jgi:hypothetical protein